MQELARIQSALHAPKNQRNEFGNYSYRKCEDILQSVKPLLAKENCSITISDDIFFADGRFYIVATARITNANGECETAKGYARECQSKKGMDEAQITGAASSYARKYALCGLLAIDDNKDADELNVSADFTAQPGESAPQVEYNPYAAKLAELSAITSRSQFEEWQRKNRQLLGVPAIFATCRELSHKYPKA